MHCLRDQTSSQIMLVAKEEGKSLAPPLLCTPQVQPWIPEDCPPPSYPPLWSGSEGGDANQCVLRLPLPNPPHLCLKTIGHAVQKKWTYN